MNYNDLFHLITLPLITLVKQHIQAREKHVLLAAHRNYECTHKHILSESFSDTVEYVWHIELDMLMKYRLCRNNEKFRQTKPIKLSNVLIKIDTWFDSDGFSAIALLQGERGFFFCLFVLSYISFL